MNMIYLNAVSFWSASDGEWILMWTHLLRNVYGIAINRNLYGHFLVFPLVTVAPHESSLND